MKTILTLAITVAFASCAGLMRKPLPMDKRTVEFINNHARTKSDAYSKAKFWVPLSIKSSGQLIKAEDPQAGMIAGDGEILCDKIVGSFFAAQHIKFKFLIQVTPKDIKIKYTDQEIITSEAEEGLKTNIFNDETQIDGVRICLKDNAQQLFDSLK